MYIKRHLFTWIMQTKMMGNSRATWSLCFFYFLLSFCCCRCCCWATESLSSFSSSSSSSAAAAPPDPTPWPLQFHSLLYINSSGALQITDLWYDWPNGRNLNIIQKQLGRKLYDVEWNNKTSFYYYLDDQKECTTRKFEVGILRPDWLNGSNYLGIQTIDGGFTCHVWEKVDFIWYYEDVSTHRPVHWRFYTGMSTHVMTFEVGAVLEDEQWQAPYYCFQKDNAQLPHSDKEDEENEFSLTKINYQLNNRIALG